MCISSSLVWRVLESTSYHLGVCLHYSGHCEADTMDRQLVDIRQAHEDGWDLGDLVLFKGVGGNISHT